MVAWTTNPIMEWSVDGGTNWTKISDHGRAPLSVSVTRIEKSQRMADGTMRRYVVAKKRTWSVSWENLPDKTTSFLSNGQWGKWMEDFYNANNGAFLMRLRAGSDRGATLTGTNGEVYTVMLTDFSKEISKRGPAFDLWNIDMTIEEV